MDHRIKNSFAIRCAINIGSAGQRRPHSRRHPRRSVYGVTSQTWKEYI